MPNPATENSVQQDPRTYFAAERTFLAWLRTGLGLMGIGFAVSRFGLFLREFQAGEQHLAPHGGSISNWSGIALVLLGVIVNLSATVRHYQLVRELREGNWHPGRVSRDAVVLAYVLAIAGIGMAVYLGLAR
jgi:inner membrane protein YidH